jgi:hypothetical protein
VGFAERICDILFVGEHGFCVFDPFLFLFEVVLVEVVVFLPVVLLLEDESLGLEFDRRLFTFGFVGDDFAGAGGSVKGAVAFAIGHEFEIVLSVEFLLVSESVEFVIFGEGVDVFGGDKEFAFDLSGEMGFEGLVLAGVRFHLNDDYNGQFVTALKGLLKRL